MAMSVLRTHRNITLALFCKHIILGHWSTNCISGPGQISTKSIRSSTIESFQPKTTQKMWIDFLPASTDQSKAVWLKVICFVSNFISYVEKVQVMLLSKEGKGRFLKSSEQKYRVCSSSQHRSKTYLGDLVHSESWDTLLLARWHSWSGLER